MFKKIFLIIICLIIFPQITRADFASGLVGYWPMDYRDNVWTSSSVGTTKDRSQGGNNGTFTSMTQKVNSVIGKIGQAIGFTSASSQYVDLPDINADDSLSAITVSAWVSFQTFALDETILGKYASSGHGLQTGTTGGITANQLIWFINDGANYVYTTQNAVTQTNTWYFIAATFDNSLGSGKHKIYLNGVSQSLSNNGLPDSVTDTGASTGNDQIGRLSSALGRYCNCTIDDARIYNRALSAQEVNTLYRLGAGNHQDSFISSIMSTLGL